MKIYSQVSDETETKEERRFQKREAFYRPNEVRIRFRIYDEEGQEKELLLTVLNLTSFGALAQSDTQIYESVLTLGSAISRIDILYNRTRVGRYSNGMIVHVLKKNGLIQVGIKFDDQFFTRKRSINERKEKRLRVNPAYTPTARCTSPITFDETYDFRVMDISNEGARLETSPRNRLLLKNTVLDPLIINLPTVGSYETSARVKYVSADKNRNRVILGVKFLKKPDDFSKGLVKVLVSFADVEEEDIIQSIRGAGFKPKHVKSQIEYSYVSSLKDYREVLKLRHQAYLRNAKLKDYDQASLMSDFYDLNSRIIIAKTRGEIVGSVRVTFCNKTEDRFEIEESASLSKVLAKDFTHFERQETFEVSRLCVDERFEHTDLVLGLVERCVQIALQTGIRHVITSCTKDMIGYYAKLGFRASKQPFHLKTLKGVPHYVLLLDTKSVTTAYRLNPIYWHFAYENMVRFVKRFGFVEKLDLSWIKKLFLKASLPWVKKQLKKKRR